MVKKSVKDESVSNGYEKKSRVKMTGSPETKDLVISCIPEFLNHHPEMDGMKITENMIIKQLALFYKRSP